MALVTDHPDAAALAALPDEPAEALDSGPASFDLDPHAGEGEPLPEPPAAARFSRLVARLAPATYARPGGLSLVYPEGARREPVEVLAEDHLADLLADVWQALGYAGADDADGRTYLAVPDPAHGWRLVGRDADGLPAGRAAALALLQALPEPTTTTGGPLGLARRRAAWSASRRIVADRVHGWQTYADRIGREALQVLAYERNGIRADDAVAPWVVLRRGKRMPFTLDGERLAEEHLATFLEYLPPGRHLSSRVREEYARTAAESGVPAARRWPLHRLLGRLATVPGVRRFRTGTGRWIEVPDPFAGAEPAAPLDPETRATLQRIVEARRAARAEEVTS